MSPVEIKEYLINKVFAMLRKKGRLVAPRNTKKMSEEEKKLRAIYMRIAGRPGPRRVFLNNN